MFQEVSMDFRDLLSRGVFHPPLGTDQLEDFLLYDSLQLVLGVVYLERGSDGENFPVNFAQTCAVRSLVPELWPEAYELLFNVREHVSACILDPERVADGEYFLVNDVLGSSEWSIPIGHLTYRLSGHRLEAYWDPAPATEAAARYEWLT